MEDFGEIEIGFNSADETINFGSKSTGSESLYEIFTTARITSSITTNDTSQVTVNCLVQHSGQIVLATGNSLKIFENANMTDLVGTVVLHTQIIDVAVSKNDKYLLICLNDGLVNIFENMSKNTTCLYSKNMNLKTSENDFIKCFPEDITPYVSSFILVYHSGTIFRVFADLENEETSEVANIVWDSEELCDFKTNISAAACSYPLVLTSGTNLNILNVQDGSLNNGDTISIKQIYPFGNKFICLDFEGHLWKMCSLTLIFFPIDYDVLLEEIFILNNDDVRILAASKKNEIGEIFLKLLEEDFSEVFSLKISYPVTLVQLLSFTEDIIFISKIFKDGRLTELRVQTVYETQPELKLAKLIRRRRFEEAEQFAKTFNVNPVIILKAKAQLIVDKIECTSQDIKHLMKLMDSIDDEIFNLECCSAIDCSNFEDIRGILIYGSRICTGNENATDKKIVLEDSLYRFDTYMALSDEKDIPAWYRFRTCNLIEELKKYLRNHNIEDAIIIYSRLEKKTLDMLTVDTIEEIINILNNIPPHCCQPFLPTFIPTTMTYIPTALPIFIKWLYQKIFLLENRDKLNFPHNGILFAENMLKLLKVNKSSISFQRQCTLIRKSLDDLSNVMSGLKMIKSLKTNFGINIQLSECFEGPEKLIHVLLNIVKTPQEYDNFLKEFLYSYMLQNRLDPDSIYLEEIENQMKYEDCWETVTSLLKHMSSIKMKLSAIIKILDYAPVPWCDTVRNMAHSALNYSHPMVSEVRRILQDEQRMIVMRNPKYKIRGAYINSRSEFIHVIRRLMYVNEISLVEDALHLCKDIKDKHDANFLLIEHFISKGDLDRAMSVLDNNSEEDIQVCACRVLIAAELRINSKMGSKTERENFYRVLAVLHTRLLATCKNKFDNERYERTIQVTRAVYNINKHYDPMNITTDKMRSSGKEILEELVDIIATDNKIGEVNIAEIFKHAERLSLYFLLDKDQILIRLCENIGRCDIILKVAEYLNDGSADAKILCKIIVLFFKYMGSSRPFGLGDSFDESSCNLMSQTIANQTVRIFDDSNDSDMLMKGVGLARIIVTKALCMAQHKDDFRVTSETLNWLGSCFYLTCQVSSVQREIFKNVYTPTVMVPNLTVFSSINSCFRTYLGYIGNLKDSSVLSLTEFGNNIPSLTQEHLMKDLSNLPRMIEQFCREGQHLTAFTLVNAYQRSLNHINQLDSKLLEFLQTIVHKKCLPQLLHIVTSANYIDVNFLYNILILAGRKNYLNYIQHYIKLYKRQPKKLYDLSVVGIKLADVYGETAGRDVMVNAAKTCKWWRKLKNVHNSFPYEDFFKCSAETRLKKLIALDHVDDDVIRAYCEDFELDAQLYYMEYLSSSLLYWIPEYVMDGEKQIIIENSEFVLLSKCQKIIDLLEDKMAVFNMLEHILIKVNFYHYEVFICIYKILENNTTSKSSYGNNIGLLCFLKNYTRHSPADQREKEEWYNTFPDSQILDPLSQYRLPFTRVLFTSDVWSILRPEVSLKTYKLWFDCSDILKTNLKIDDICMYAVKEMMASGVLGDKTSKSWVLFPKFEDLFEAVDTCVQYISDMENATSVIYHLMHHIPNGADKVTAAQLSYKYMAKYMEKCPDSPDIQKAYVKVRNKYYGFSAMHILYKYNLATDRYLNLVSQPQTLIENLYKDSRTLKGTESVSLEVLDVNRAVDELAELFELNIVHIRQNLLNRWLNCSNIIDLDTTLPIVEFEEADNNLKRATYMCSTSDIEYWQIYLLKVGLFEDEGQETEQNFSFKARALKCFCSITDEEKISQMTKLTYTELWNLVNKLSLLGELEVLGISFDLDTLDQYNKKKLLKRLSQLGTTFAIKAMGSICMTYSLEDNRYWEYIINNSIKLGMSSELKVYVEFLRNKCDKGFYLKAWQYIIEQAFHRSSLPSDAVQDIFVDNFLMIQSCPVLFHLDFENIVQKCIALKKPEFAAILLQYLSEEKRRTYMEEITERENLPEKLDILECEGIWGIHNVKHWMNI